MESVIKQSLNVKKKCNAHEIEFVAVCINKVCEFNGLVCYNCIYKNHVNHIKDCIPLNLWKIEVNSNTGQDVINSNLDKILVKVKDLNHIIQNHFLGLYEKLIVLKDNLERNGVISLFQMDIPIFYKYHVLDNEYLITQKDLDEIIEKFEICFLKEIEKHITKEFSKLYNHSNVMKRTERRLTTISDNWSQSKSYYDAIGFKVLENILLCGIGIYELTDTKPKMPIEISLYKEEINESNKIFSQNIDLKQVELKFDNRISDLLFNNEISLKMETTYIICKSNVEENPHCYYGKNPSVPIPPFQLISWKEKSQSYKSGNYTDLGCGAFPYFLYK